MFLQKSFIGKNKWYLYLLVLVLVFVLAQVGGIPFAVYAMMTNLDAVQAGDTAALSKSRARRLPMLPRPTMRSSIASTSL